MNDQLNLVQFAPNVPQQLALSDPEGMILEGRFKDQVFYQLTDGRGMVLDMDTAAKVNLLGLQKAEAFSICKNWSGRPKDPMEFTVWLSPSSEKQRAATEDPEDLMEQLRLSIEMARQPKSVPRKPLERVSASPQMIRGTGTNGPAPQPQALPFSTPPSRPGKQQIPYNVAFLEVTQFVTKNLDAAGEQWSDQARQDMVSTILISAAKQGLLSVWERGK